MLAKIQKMKQLLDESHKIVFFGGAGVSTESGIPDFRSTGGVFMKPLGGHYSAEEIVSHDFFMEHPKEFFDFYFKNLVHEEAKPNKGHLFIADLEKVGKDVTVITQNIDGLHQKAGSSHVLELHGTVLDNYCTACGEYYALDTLVLDEEGIPRCQKDGAIVKPAVVLYQEALDPQTLAESIQALREADLLIVAGTSLAVYPAAGLLQYYSGDKKVVINKTPLTAFPDTLVFEDSIGHVFEEVEQLNA